jgi:hypothetical protein
MRALRAFVLGAVAGAVLAYVAAATAALAASVSGTELEAAVGPVVFVAVERVVGGTEVTFGPGLAAISVSCGVVNAAVAAILALRVR